MTDPQALTPQAMQATHAAPMVSVIVRSMDRPSLGAALESVASQTFDDLELVVVNARGTSHRELPLVRASFVLRMTGSGGPLPRGAAANVGLGAARGARILFLDDDDLLLPDHLHKLVAALDASTDAVAAYADVSMGSFDGGHWREQHLFAAEFDPVRLRFENYLPMHGVLIDRARSGCASSRWFDESFELFEDWDFWQQLAEAGPFVHVPGVSARYVTTPDGNSGVFAESDLTRAARARLFAKWRFRMSDQDHAALLARAQSLYRSVHAAQAQLADLRAQLDSLHSVLGARDAEIAGVHTLLQAREAEIANAIEYSGSLRDTLAARDAELAARDAELAARDVDLAARNVDLAARDDMLADARAQVAALEDALAARQALLDQLHARLAALHAESPPAAFMRALRTRLHGSDPH